MWVQSLVREDPLEEEKATHSSILAWRIPWTEEPGELQSIGSDMSEQLSTAKISPAKAGQSRDSADHHGSRESGPCLLQGLFVLISYLPSWTLPFF